MNRRSFAAAALTAPLLTGCFYDRYFDLSWEEEVLLHDGRVIVVKLKHTYYRLSQGLTPYGGTSITRDTTLTFDAGGTTGMVSQLFMGFHPLFLGQHGDVWYVTMYGANYGKSNEIPGQNWGLGWYDCPIAAMLDNKQFKPISIHDLPDVFKRPNIMLLYGEASEHAHFDGKRVTLKEKAEWLEKHSPGSGHAVICRPPTNAIKPANLFEYKNSAGEIK